MIARIGWVLTNPVVLPVISIGGVLALSMLVR